MHFRVEPEDLYQLFKKISCMFPTYFSDFYTLGRENMYEIKLIEIQKFTLFFGNFAYLELSMELESI